MANTIDEPYAVKDSKTINDPRVQHVIKCYENSKQWRRAKATRWDQYYTQWRGYITKSQYPWRSNLFIPVTFSAVETVKPRLVQAIFGLRPFVTVRGRGPEDEVTARNVEHLLDYEFDMRMGVFAKAEKWFDEILILGTGVVKLVWKQEDQAYSEVDDKGKRHKLSRRVYDDPFMDVVSLPRFFIQPGAQTIEEAKWVVHEVDKDWQELQEDGKRGRYKNTEYVMPDAKPAEQTALAGTRRSAQGLNAPEQYKRKTVQLLEYWGKYDIDDDGYEEECVITVANGILLRADYNPFHHGKKPFIAVPCYPDLDSFYGIGFPEMLASLQLAMNDTENQTMDNENLVIQKMFKVRRDAGILKSDLVARPGGVVYTNDMDGVDTFQQGDVATSAYRRIEILLRHIERTTGVTDFQKGTSEVQTGSETATEAAIKTEQGNMRIDLMIRRFQETAVKQLAQMTMDLLRQFMDSPRWVRITGSDEGANVSPEDIQGQFDLIPIGSSLAGNRVLRRNQSLAVLDRFYGLPEIDNVPLVRMCLSNLDDIVKDPSEIMKDPKTLEMLRMMPQMAPMGPGGGAAPQGRPQSGSPPDLPAPAPPRPGGNVEIPRL